jgi:phage terminase large subunit-like protein
MNYAGMDIHNIYLSTFVVDVRENGIHKWVARHWLPARNLSMHPEYKDFVKMGAIRLMPGEVADIDFMITEVQSLRKQYGFNEISCDAWSSSSIFSHILERSGMRVVEQQLNFKLLNNPTRALVKMQNQILFGNPVLAWMFHNVMLINNSSGDIKPIKKLINKPIGGLVAAIMALGRALQEDGIDMRTEFYYAE